MFGHFDTTNQSLILLRTLQVCPEVSKKKLGICEYVETLFFKYLDYPVIGLHITLMYMYN